MSAAPEEFLAQGAYLAAPEPFSPSIFLDLPPTPRPNGDDPTSDDPASSDDLVLPFISRMLMEEDIDDKFFYQYPDHPALLSAQQPYAQILSDATASSSSDSAAVTSSGTGVNFTLSSSSSAPPSADPTWPYDPIELSQLLRSPPYPDIGVGLDDFTADEVNAVFLPGQDTAFQLNPAFLDTAAG